MRTIKFRGRCLDNKEWVFGNFALCDNGSAFIHDLVEPDENCWLYWEVDPNTVGQFTGLHDNNGVEIYEGDVVECQVKKNENYRVVRCLVCYGEYTEDAGSCEGFPDSTHLGLYVKVEGDNREMRSIMEELECYVYEEKKVIGNIHDNSSLWKGESQ